jgi:hypothetical protein
MLLRTVNNAFVLSFTNDCIVPFIVYYDYSLSSVNAISRFFVGFMTFIGLIKIEGGFLDNPNYTYC